MFFNEIFISIFTFRNIDRNIANVFLSWGKNIFHVLSLDAKKKKREREARREKTGSVARQESKARRPERESARAREREIESECVFVRR